MDRLFKIVTAGKKAINNISNFTSQKEAGSFGQTVTGIISKLTIRKILIGLIPAFAVVLILIAPLLIFPNSFSAVDLLTKLDQAFADEGNDDCNGGNILLIAGHSYSPYCNQVSNECRGTTTSGYAEEEETRSLVKLIKSELQNLNVNADIANQLMAPGDDRMNTSFFVESTLNTDTFNSIDWTKYKYVLEVHFNAGGGKGPLLVKNSSGYTTDADEGIINAVTKNLNTSQLPDSIQSLNDLGYFTSRNIPITYLETEFYDNKDAMDNYTNKKSEVAKGIAQAIKDTYGKGSNVGSARQEVVNRAKAELGKPYVWGAAGPDGYDCSGLVGYALTGTHERIGTTLTFWGWQETNDPKPGDIAVIDNGSGSGHTGIYIGDGQMVHAAGTGIGVIIGPVQAGMKYVVYEGLANDSSSCATNPNTSAPSGEHLTPSGGVFEGPSGKETYYNLDMSGVISLARNLGITGEYWVRDDGVKMLGDYIMVAANLDIRPKGTIVDTSLGKGIVVDTGGFAASNPTQLDIAVSW